MPQTLLLFMVHTLMESFDGIVWLGVGKDIVNILKFYKNELRL